MKRPHWRLRAACVGEDPEIFHVELRGRPTKAAGIDKRLVKPLSVCADCPVWRECLTAALRTNSTGVRGRMNLRPTSAKSSLVGIHPDDRAAAEAVLGETVRVEVAA